MCSVPVTFGGGSWMQYGSRSGRSDGSKYPRDSHSGYHYASTACGSKLFGSSMNGAKSVDYSDRCRSPYGGAHIATAFGP